MNQSSPPKFIMNRMILTVALFLAATFSVQGVGTQGTSLPLLPNSSVIDVDALAARMKHYGDTYARIRDQSLETYRKGRSANLPIAVEKTAIGDADNKRIDDEAGALIRIIAYLWVWGDSHGEGLAAHADDYDHDLLMHGCHDPFVKMVAIETQIDHGYSSNEQGTQVLNSITDYFLSSNYPPELKIKACTRTVYNLIKYRLYAQPPANAASLQKIPGYIAKWGELYREVLKGKPTHDQAYTIAAKFLELSQDDQNALDLIIAEIDRSFNEIDANNPVRTVLDGQYYVQAAWNARGSGWANAVSDEGWKLFSERLDKAAKILEAAYAQYPDEGGIARLMMTVELGQGQGRDRLELWFQRAIKVNPDDYDAYCAKEWYLQPRWHGSLDDTLSFGDECVNTGNWNAKLPMVLQLGIRNAANGDPALYKRDDIWVKLEKPYRDFLSHYPTSVFYRTCFARDAFDSGHLDVSREQFAILGNNWDREVLKEADYRAMAATLGTK